MPPHPGKSAQERTLTHPLTALPPALDLIAATPLAASLLASRGQPIEPDASAVERLGAQCLQVLGAAQSMLHLALFEASYRVVQAVDGVHGLAQLEGERPDVIVTDINMPRLDGFGFIEGVRRECRYRAIPILVLTTESDGAKKARAREAGANGWIVKPFNPAKLVDALRRVAA